MSSRGFIVVVLSTLACMQGQPNAQVEPSSTASIQIPAPALTARDRFRWVTLKTFGPKNLGAGVFVAGFKTWRDEPEAYGPHWDGFAKRYGERLATGGTSNALEAVFGSFWGENPRYYRAAGQPLKVRFGHAVKMAFVTHNKAGDPQPAYARYIAVPGGILISNTWRPDSPDRVGSVLLQVGIGFVSRIVGNTFSEFVPDLLNRNRNAPQNKQGPQNTP